MTKLNTILKQVTPPENPFRNYFLPNTSISSAAEQKVRILNQEMEVLLKWVMQDRDRISEQELEDFIDEFFRTWVMFTYEALEIQLEKRTINLGEEEKQYKEQIKKYLGTGLKLSECDNCVKQSC